jgi:hypothetical protein
LNISPYFNNTADADFEPVNIFAKVVRPFSENLRFKDPYPIAGGWGVILGKPETSGKPIKG